MLDYAVQTHNTISRYDNNDSICCCLRAFVDSIYVRL